MHYGFVDGLEVTYGNALAAGNGFHRVTTADGVAAEVAPHTYLWYKLSTETTLLPSCETIIVPLAIMQLSIQDELPPDGPEGEWIKLDKSIDRQNGRYLWYQASQFRTPSSLSAPKQDLMPLQHIRVVRDLKDVPDGYESLDEPLLNSDGSGVELRTYLCFRRLSYEDCLGSKWSILNQKAGDWIEIKELSSNKWNVGQILQQSPSEIRVHISTWNKGRDEFLSLSTCRNRVAKLGTFTNFYMTPAYPFLKKQGGMWHANMMDLQHARDQFDKYFYDRERQKTYLLGSLLPFIEKSLLSTFLSSDLANEMNAFHQHVLKNVVASILSNDAKHIEDHLLSLLRMILNGHSSCLFFYIKYTGSYTSQKYQRLVYTSYLVSLDALAAIPVRHPCRSLYFIDNVDLFIQAGGFQLILDRLALSEIALTEVLLYCTILNGAKPCLVQQKQRRNSASSRLRSTIEVQIEDFFWHFVNAAFCRLRRMSGEELKTDDGLIGHIVGILELICRDVQLLESCSADLKPDTRTATFGVDIPDERFAKSIEIFHLDLSKKFLCCPYLSKRLLGIARINEMISMAQRKDALQRQIGNISKSTAPATSMTSSMSAKLSNVSSIAASEQPTTKWLCTNYIVEWLTDSDILEVILGDRDRCDKYALQSGTHLEILKRSKKIFGFVAAHGLLTEKHIIKMWKVAHSQLRSGKIILFDILITLCGILPADMMDVVTMLLTQVPSKEYDELIVGFIKRVIMIASKLIIDTETGSCKMISLTSLVCAASGSSDKPSTSVQKDLEVLNKVVNLCCTLYWNAILQPKTSGDGESGLHQSMQIGVEIAMADSLNYVQRLWVFAAPPISTPGKEQQQLLKSYLHKCADNIRSGLLVETSMSLIERVVDGLSVKAKLASTMSGDLLKELNKVHNIVSVVVDALIGYFVQSNVRSRLEPAYLDALRKRFAFLGYLVTHSDLELPLESLNRLWGCFNGAENTMEERDIFFSWLTLIIPDPNSCTHEAYPGHAGFTVAVVAKIFQSLIRPQSIAKYVESTSQISLDMRLVGEEAFWALERLFRFINTTLSRMSVAGSIAKQRASFISNDAELFVIESMDLQGLNLLYDVALCAENASVSCQAINYLIYLHLHVGSNLRRYEVWKDFVNNCFRRLQENIKTALDHMGIRKVLRLLTLLCTFLYQFAAQTQENSATEETHNDLEELVVYVRTQNGRFIAPFRYHLMRTSLVSGLRDRIAKDTGHSVDRICILNSAKEKITSHERENYTLKRARVFDDSPHTSSEALSLTQTAILPTHRTVRERISYVEVLLLSKIESDTNGPTYRSNFDFYGAAGVNAVASSGTGKNSCLKSDCHAIKVLISENETWVTLLFNFLSFNDQVAEEAWKILKLLPTNNAMEMQTRTLNGMLAIDGSIRKRTISFDWDALLDPKCFPKLLYQLELVEYFALCRDESSSENRDENSHTRTGIASVTSDDDLIGATNTWSASFIQLGGLAQLEKIVLWSSMHQPFHQGALYMMCLSKILKLLRHFVLVESKLEEVSGNANQKNFRQLTYQLLKTLKRLQNTDEASDKAVLCMPIQKEQLVTKKKSFREALKVCTHPHVDDSDNAEKLPCGANLMLRLLSCVATCTLVGNQGAQVFLEIPFGHGDIILHCLVNCRYKPIRLMAASVIAALSTTRDKLKDDRDACCVYFLQLLGGYSGPVNTEEYYNVFTLLVTSAEDLTKFSILPACNILSRRIKEFENNDEGICANYKKTVVNGRTKLDVAVPALNHQNVPSAKEKPLEGPLKVLLAIIKRIPAILVDSALDVPGGNRSLREMVASALHDQEGMIHELFNQCLFARPDEQSNGISSSDNRDCAVLDIQTYSTSQYYLRQPKCNTDSSRKIAFDLLMELLIENNGGLRFLLTQMTNQHTLEFIREPSAATSTLSPHKRKNSKSKKEALIQRGKYVGLKNLGCTCYLNSIVQSFFMMPRFRRQVLRLELSDCGNGVKNLIYELQSLFAHLEGSAKPYYNPRPFTRAMKSCDGEKISLNVQQDASEFLTSFFQQIESEMNGISAKGEEPYTSDENILDKFFGGEFSNELIAEGDRYSERFEPFHFISVPIRDRKNLKESLDGWVQGEKVSYMWESCVLNKSVNNIENANETDTKVTLETHKRISISKLPSYLIIHLKRFEFDFEKMQQIKLHDRFEFPVKLDMYPYTKEGQQESRKRSAAPVDDEPVGHNIRSSTSADSIEDGRPTAPEYSKYELVGTVVHNGTAHSGHYYSFLRDQQVPRDNDQWYEFNDTLVTPFDAARIPDECFGGKESPHIPSSESEQIKMKSAPLLRMRSRSSFMLFYARVSPELQIVSHEYTPRVSFVATVLALAFILRLKRRAAAKLEQLRRVIRIIAPEPIRKLIAMENRLFWREKYLYDARSLKFTYNLLQFCLKRLESANNSGLMSRSEAVEIRFEALQVATKFVFGTLWQGGYVSKVLEWRHILQSLYNSDVAGSRWLLSTMEANESLLLELLVYNKHQEIRELMANLLLVAIATISNTTINDNAPKKASNLLVGNNKQVPPSFKFMLFVIQLMPSLLSVPVHQHHQYFITIYEFVRAGSSEGYFLVTNSVVGAIVSLLTGLGSTQQLFQLQMKKHKQKQILKRIDLSVTILKLLSVLLRYSLPPAIDIVSDSAIPSTLPVHLAQDSVELLPADRDVLFNERFITLLTQRANHYTKETKPLEQIISHLCWESQRATAAFLDKIVHGIKVEDHHDVKSYFRAFNSLLKIRDSLADERLTLGLTKLVAVMASQQRYYKATETSLDMLTRLSKRHSGVTHWLRSNRQSCVWMEKWLVAHRGVDGYLQQRKTVLVKPNSTSSWVNVSVLSSGLIKAIDRSITKLLPRIRDILDPEAVVEHFYDSDDNPKRLVGKRVRVKWAKDKWYEGTVQEFNEETYEHFVAYDDGDKRSYHMSEKQFYVVK
ncbi:hypothetical protein CCR75_000411 [Bremia lactucae]|uniref:USP domain-containing protein n=1 Tax=Bremia lactucae TaxID=4779 RepID=A0A976ICX7_BRELC|nr:hypothetical protein CCR75_000411 [Bremia lactucae]